jgi:oligopeptide transport system permease protein
MENKSTDIKNSEKFEFVKLDTIASEKIDAPRYSYWHAVSRQFFSSKVAIGMLILLMIIMGFSFIQPMFSNYNFMDTETINDFGARYNEPSLKHWFGTDANGQSLFNVVWAGARTSIAVGILATLINTIIGVIVGAIWGSSKAVDKVMIEIYNVVSNVPVLLIVIMLSYAFGSGFWNLLFAMCATSWISTAYFIRLQVMIRRDSEYNLASKALGTRSVRLITRNILPYLISVIVTDVSRSMPSFISYEVFLSYLGVGLSADVPSLGRVIAKYTSNITNYPYLFWIPVTVLALVTVSMYIVGQSLADASDPRTHR